MKVTNAQLHRVDSLAPLANHAATPPTTVASAVDTYPAPISPVAWSPPPPPHDAPPLTQQKLHALNALFADLTAAIALCHRPDGHQFSQDLLKAFCQIRLRQRQETLTELTTLTELANQTSQTITTAQRQTAQRSQYYSHIALQRADWARWSHVSVDLVQASAALLLPFLLFGNIPLGLMLAGAAAGGGALTAIERYVHGQEATAAVFTGLHVFTTVAGIGTFATGIGVAYTAVNTTLIAAISQALAAYQPTPMRLIMLGGQVVGSGMNLWLDSRIGIAELTSKEYSITHGALAFALRNQQSSYRTTQESCLQMVEDHQKNIKALQRMLQQSHATSRRTLGRLA